MSNLKLPYSEVEILRYLQGSMTPAEQHSMELAALNDDFLNDAIDGYRMALEHEKSSDLLATVEGLKNGKTDVEVPKRLIPFWQQPFLKYAVAASLILGGGWFVFSLQNNTSTTQNTDTVTVSPNTTAVDSATNTTVIAPVPGPKSVEQISLKPKSEPPITALKPAENIASTPENVPAVPNKIADIKDLASNTTTGESAGKTTIAAVPEPMRQVDMAIKADAPTAKKSYNTDNLKQATTNNVVGKVVNNEQFPLEAITLTVKETGKVYTSDELGRFTLKSPDTVATVVATGIGFETKEFSLSSTKSLNQIELMPKQSQLEEVVISGYSAKRKKAAAPRSNIETSEIDTSDAIPLRGWDEFENYLYRFPKKEMQETPPGKVAVVVSFEINEKGRPENFYIIKSGGKTNDAEAIKRIENGPNWKPKGPYPVFAKITVFL